MAQLSLLGYPKVSVSHYDRKDAVRAATVEEAKELAGENMFAPAIVGYDGDVLVFSDDLLDSDELEYLYVIVE